MEKMSGGGGKGERGEEVSLVRHTWQVKRMKSGRWRTCWTNCRAADVRRSGVFYGVNNASFNYEQTQSLAELNSRTKRR